VNLNETVPDFRLPDLHGVVHRLDDLRGRIVIVNFWSAECPHSERTDQVLMAALHDWADEVALLAIASNASETPETIRRVADARRLPLVLHDGDQIVAELFAAEMTPHVFVIDQVGVLRYRGAVDDVSFAQRAPTRSFVSDAVERLRAGRMPDIQETAAYGCAIVRRF